MQRSYLKYKQNNRPTCKAFCINTNPFKHKEEGRKETRKLGQRKTEQNYWRKREEKIKGGKIILAKLNREENVKCIEMRL
jgi:hypothetical protein